MKGAIVTDTFTRTLASGWGNADTGQAWSTFGASGTINATDWSTNGTAGLHSVPATNGYRASYLAAFAQAYADVVVDASVAVMPVGGPLELGNLMTRGTSISAYYLFRVQVSPAGVVSAAIFNPGGTTLGTITIPGVTYTAGLVLRIRAQSIGQVHRIKVWPVANVEPVAWPLTAVDSTSTAAGWVGVRSGVASGVTNALPVVFTCDNFRVVQVADFPNDVLPLTVLAAFGADLSKDPSTWPWQNITADVRGGNVVITPGRADETSQASPASCSFQLFNDNKAYSANNPNGPNYPNVKRNTPIWVIIDPATRFFGYANGFVPSWDTSGKQAIVSVSASGALRRQTQGKGPVASPLYRAITARTDLRAYWSMEDGAGSLSAAPGVAGGATMATNNLTFAADSTEPGSAPLAKFTATSSLSGVISGSFANQWQIDWYYKITDPTPNEPTIMEITTTSGMRWVLTVGGSFATVLTVYAYNSAGTQVVNSAFTVGSVYFGQWVHIGLMVRPNGANIDWQVVIFPLTGNGNFLPGSVAGTVGAPTTVSIPANAALNGMAMGHLAAFDAYNNGSTQAAQTGFANELVTDRLIRLCADRGVPLTIIGTSTTRMGPQPIDSFVNLLRECEAADLGLLYDGFGPGLGYICRSSRYNLPAAMTLDMAAGQVDDPFAPADDDQRNRNLWKVDRKGGSSATYEDKTGPLGTNPVKGIGTYDSSTTINVATDDVLPDYASWLVHMGTVEGFRYPSLNLDLGANPALIDGWMAARLNSHIDVLNVDSKATGHTPGIVSVLDEGYTETLGPKTWAVVANCSPYVPWQVFTLDTDRLDADPSSQLVAGITATATTFQVSTANIPGALWTTDSTEWTAPKVFYINVAGEQMQVTNITGATSPQTFTVVRSINGVVKAQAATAYVGLWQPRALAL